MPCAVSVNLVGCRNKTNFLFKATTTASKGLILRKKNFQSSLGPNETLEVPVFKVI